MRSTTSSLAVSIAVLLAACGAPSVAPSSGAEQSAPRGAARSIPPSSKADPIVEPHQMPNGERSVFGTATARPTPDGSTVLSGTFIGDDGRPVAGGPHGPRGALSLSLDQAATESRRVQLWPADAKLAGDEWAGVRTVHPGKTVVLTGLLEGDYELEVMGVRHVLRTVAVTIIAGETVKLVLEND